MARMMGTFTFFGLDTTKKENVLYKIIISLNERNIDMFTCNYNIFKTREI